MNVKVQGMGTGDERRTHPTYHTAHGIFPDGRPYAWPYSGRTSGPLVSTSLCDYGAESVEVRKTA